MDLSKAKGEIKFEGFFKKYYMNYILYRVMQRLPSIMDGCIQTHRKIVYTMFQSVLFREKSDKPTPHRIYRFNKVLSMRM